MRRTHRSTRAPAKDWLAELHRDGDWRSVAHWLARHDSYLADSMAGFVASMQRRGDPPTPKQFGLLVSLRGGVEALMRYEAIQEAAEQDTAGGGDVCQDWPDADTARVLH
jgi:hypothetical protein